MTVEQASHSIALFRALLPRRPRRRRRRRKSGKKVRQLLLRHRHRYRSHSFRSVPSFFFLVVPVSFRPLHRSRRRPTDRATDAQPPLSLGFLLCRPPLDLVALPAPARAARPSEGILRTALRSLLYSTTRPLFRGRLCPRVRKSKIL